MFRGPCGGSSAEMQILNPLWRKFDVAARGKDAACFLLSGQRQKNRAI